MNATNVNRLLEGLEQRELQTLRAQAQEVTLERGVAIVEAGQSSPHIFFPLNAVLSLVGMTENGATVEVAVVGNEGMASVSAAFGDHISPYRVMTQVAGTALRIPPPLVMQSVLDCGEFHARVLAYIQTVIAQISQSAICNRFHNAQQRLARWLLLTADRAGSRELPLTHEFISSMVGGPRSAVTEAASSLRQNGAIEYRRGLVTIRSVELLQQQACECYAAVAEKIPAVSATTDS